jgi:glutamate-1-semialdehyde aminotransferase
LLDYRTSQPSPAQAAKISALHRGLLDRGVFMGASAFGCVSTAMTGAEIEVLVEKVSQALQEV